MTAPKPRPGVAFLALFASLYAVQGVVVAYLFNYHKNYLAAWGLRDDVIGGLQSLALLPLALKFLVGPISDRFNLLGLGHRLPYIVIGLAGQAAGLVGLALVEPSGHVPLFAGLGVLTVVGLAVYDTCCDGLVVDVTPAEDRARVQGLLWTSRFLAATLMTLAFGAWLDRLGGPRHADRLLWASAALTMLPAVLALMLREPPRAVDAERFEWSALRAMVRPRSLALLAFGGLYGLAGMGVESNVSRHYAEIGFGPGGDVGLLGACRNLGRAGGALLLPLAVARLPRRGVIVLGIAALAASIAGQALVGHRPEAVAMALAFGLAVGWDDTLFAFLAMEASDPRLAASTFALFMAVTNLSVVGDAMFARGVTATGGYTVPLLGAAAVALSCLPLAWPLGRAQASPDPDRRDLAS